jgi:hypothetical protein
MSKLTLETAIAGALDEAGCYPVSCKAKLDGVLAYLIGCLGLNNPTLAKQLDDLRHAAQLEAKVEFSQN